MRSSCRWGARPRTTRRSCARFSRSTNIRGALITMPHKVTTVGLLDEVSPHGADRRRLQRRAAHGGRPPARRHVRRRRLRARRAAQGLRARRCDALWSSAAAASARRSPRRWPPRAWPRSACSTRTPNRRRDSPRACDSTIRGSQVSTGSNDPAGYDARGQRDAAGHERRRSAADRRVPHRARHLRRRGRDEEGDDGVPAAPRRRAVAAIQVGTDMLFEQIPAYLEFFGFPTTTPEDLRAVARLSY